METGEMLFEPVSATFRHGLGCGRPQQLADGNGDKTGRRDP